MENRKIYRMAIGVGFVLIILCMFLLFPRAAYPADKWTTLDYTLQSAVITTQIIDWGQTRDITKNPTKFHENNKFLGEHPSTRKVDIYFPVYIMTTIGVSHILPKPYRNIFQVLMTIYQYDLVNKNHQLGLKINF